MQVTAGDKTFEIDPEDVDTVTGFREIDTIERAFGKEFKELRYVQRCGALVWVVVQRQDPTVRIGDIDFDLGDLQPPDLFTEEEAAELAKLRERIEAIQRAASERAAAEEAVPLSDSPGSDAST